MPGASKGHKSMSNPLELELQMICEPQVGMGELNLCPLQITMTYFSSAAPDSIFIFYF